MIWAFGAALLIFILAGCSSLLPASKEVSASPWQSYQEAQLTFDKIIPGSTTLSELRSMSLDPEASANITILNYSDVMRRFMANQSVSLADLDRGVQDCVSAKILCRGYEINQQFVNKERNGNFWLDLFGFKRETHTSGWKFCGLVLVKEGVVIYKLTSGQPKIEQTDHTKNPLGPVQALGSKVFGFP